MGTGLPILNVEVKQTAPNRPIFGAVHFTLSSSREKSPFYGQKKSAIRFRIADLIVLILDQNRTLTSLQ